MRKSAHKRRAAAADRVAHGSYDVADARGLVSVGSLGESAPSWLVKCLVTSGRLVLPPPPLVIFSRDLPSQLLALVKRGVVERLLVQRLWRRYVKFVAGARFSRWRVLTFGRRRGRRPSWSEDPRARRRSLDSLESATDRLRDKAAGRSRRRSVDLN